MKKRPVRCLNNGKVFKSISDAARWGNTKPSSIVTNIKGTWRSAGRDPETDETLKWEYVE